VPHEQALLKKGVRPRGIISNRGGRKDKGQEDSKRETAAVDDDTDFSMAAC
jgi:hypothetical protein